MTGLFSAGFHVLAPSSQARSFTLGSLVRVESK